MGMAIDKAGGDDMPLGVNCFIGAAIDLPDSGDTAVGDADVGLVTREPGAVDYGAAAHNYIVLHAYLLSREAAAFPPVDVLRCKHLIRYSRSKVKGINAY